MHKQGGGNEQETARNRTHSKRSQTKSSQSKRHKNTQTNTTVMPFVYTYINTRKQGKTPVDFVPRKLIVGYVKRYRLMCKSFYLKFNVTGIGAIVNIWLKMAQNAIGCKTNALVISAHARFT